MWVLQPKTELQRCYSYGKELPTKEARYIGKRHKGSESIQTTSLVLGVCQRMLLTGDWKARVMGNPEFAEAGPRNAISCSLNNRYVKEGGCGIPEDLQMKWKGLDSARENISRSELRICKDFFLVGTELSNALHKENKSATEQTRMTIMKERQILATSAYF